MPASEAVAIAPTKSLRLNISNLLDPMIHNQPRLRRRPGYQPPQTLRRKEIALKRSQMETAVYVDHLASRIGEIAARDGRHRATYVLRLSPSSDGPGALIDHPVVFFLYAF